MKKEIISSNFVSDIKKIIEDSKKKWLEVLIR